MATLIIGVFVLGFYSGVGLCRWMEWVDERDDDWKR